MTENTKTRITFRKEKRLSGVSGVFQSARLPSYQICINGENIGTVQGLSRDHSNYFWYLHSDEYGIPHKNTCWKPAMDIDAAKAECKAYIIECLKAKGLK